MLCVANALDWRQMSVLTSASGVGLAGSHLSGRIDGRASRDKGGGDRVTQGAAQGWAWSLSTSTPCHRLPSRPPEKTQGAERFYSCVGPESALSLWPYCWGACNIFHQPQRAGGRISWSSGGNQGGLGRRKGEQSGHDQGLALPWSCTKSRLAPSLRLSIPICAMRDRNETRESVTQTPRGQQLEFSTPSSAPNAATRTYGPGVATTLGFVEQSQKSGFLRAITSFFNVCKTSSRPKETRLRARIDPQGQHTATSPSSLLSRASRSIAVNAQEMVGYRESRSPPPGGPPALASPHPPSRGGGLWIPSGAPTYICTCGGWKRPWLML